jgi:hypothetical protein
VNVVPRLLWVKIILAGVNFLKGNFNMHKYLILILVVVLILFAGRSKHPKYVIGDCFVEDNQPFKETWEDNNEFFYKVVKVGVKNYLVNAGKYNVVYSNKKPVLLDKNFSFGSWDDMTHKVQCPNFMKE